MFAKRVSDKGLISEISKRTPTTQLEERGRRGVGRVGGRQEEGGQDEETPHLGLESSTWPCPSCPHLPLPSLPAELQRHWLTCFLSILNSFLSLNSHTFIPSVWTSIIPSFCMVGFATLWEPLLKCHLLQVFLHPFVYENPSIISKWPWFPHLV